MSGTPLPLRVAEELAAAQHRTGVTPALIRAATFLPLILVEMTPQQFEKYSAKFYAKC